VGESVAANLFYSLRNACRFHQRQALLVYKHDRST
jgi:hypothetical protein